MHYGVSDQEVESMTQHLALAERGIAHLLRSTSCSVLSKRGGAGKPT